MKNNYYQYEIRNLSFGELTRLAPNWIERIVCYLVKLCRIWIRIPHAYRYPDQLILIAERALPEHIVGQLNEQLEPLRSVLIEHEFVCDSPMIGPIEDYNWVGLLDDGNVAGFYNINRTDESNYIDEKDEFYLATPMRDGRILMSSPTLRRHNVPKTVDFQTFAKTDLPDLLEQHKIRIANDVSKVKRMDNHSVEDFALSLMQMELQTLIDKSALVLVPDDRVQTLRARSKPVPTAATGEMAAMGSFVDAIFWAMAALGFVLLVKSGGLGLDLLFGFAFLGVGLLGGIGLMIYRLIKSS